MESEPPGDDIHQDAKRTGDEGNSNQKTNEGDEALTPQETALVPTTKNGNTEARIADDNRGRDSSPEPDNRGHTGMTPAEKQMAFLTLLIFLATAANVWVFYLESEDTSKQIKILSDKAGGIVDSMNTALSNNQAAIKDAFQQNKAALDASIKQASKVLDASIDASRTDQRAWVALPSFALLREPVDGDPGLVYSAINTGKTPAFMATSKSMTGLYIAGAEPPQADWRKIVSDMPIILSPGPVPHKVNIPFPTLIPEAINLYKAHVTNLMVRVRVDYRDAFGRPHFIEACSTHIYGSSLNGEGFMYCKTGNKTDEERAPNEKGNPN